MGGLRHSLNHMPNMLRTLVTNQLRSVGWSFKNCSSIHFQFGMAITPLHLDSHYGMDDHKPYQLWTFEVKPSKSRGLSSFRCSDCNLGLRYPQLLDMPSYSSQTDLLLNWMAMFDGEHDFFPALILGWIYPKHGQAFTNHNGNIVWRWWAVANDMQKMRLCKSGAYPNSCHLFHGNFMMINHVGLRVWVFLGAKKDRQTP